MKEAYLHHIWFFRLFDDEALKSEEGESIEVLDTGEPNTNAGPDFFNARIKIGETVWAGNVELHIKTSDWEKHKHQNDRAYDNVILHVVWIADRLTQVQHGRMIPVVALQELTPDPLSEHCMLMSQQNIPVSLEDLLGSLNEDQLQLWLERLLIERLEEKSLFVESLLELNANNWEETAYQILFQSFGLKVNKQPFEMLARSLKAKTILKHRDQALQVEALLFGQSGLLIGNWKDEYPQNLAHEYSFLRKKYSLEPMDAHIWKFGRLRPSNFPTIRLAQFATLVAREPNLFDRLKACETKEDCWEILKIELNEYWRAHYLFDKPTEKPNKQMGEQAKYIIAINAIAVLQYAFGKVKNAAEYKAQSLKLLKSLPAENNAVTRKYRELGIDATDAAQGQALLQLKKRIKKVQRLL